MLDLSDYMKKKDAATKTDINALTAALANKLDATPQHKHQIDDIKQLQNALDGKLDKGERYPSNQILSDVEKIAYIEAPRVKQLDISANNSIDGYIFYVDPASGDLMITLNDVLIGSYSIAAGKWSFEPDMTHTEAVLENHTEALNAVCNATLRNITDISSNRTKITAFESALNEYVAKTDAVLKNHYDAILLLCQKHGMIDGDGDEGNNITPQ